MNTTNSTSSHKFRKTKIVATLGPACNDVEKMVEMIEAGMNCARFNFSHGDHEEHKDRYEKLHEAMKITGKKVALLLDTKGPEIRTGVVDGEAIELQDMQKINVSGHASKTTKDCIALSYTGIHLEVQPDMLIKIADGSIVLRIVKIEDNNIVCKVIKGGLIGSRKNVNIPGAIINLPNVSEKDIQDIKFAVQHNYDYIAASFVRSAAAVQSIRDIILEAGGALYIIAKIENQEGLDNLESIAKIADGIMIARGDLAEQILPEQVPLMQKKIIKYCLKNKKLTITATQMLQSMENSITPTRAELTDVANAIFDGTDAIMLSGETAKGLYPIEAIKTMHNVALAVETSEQFKEHARNTFFANERDALFGESDAGDSLIAAAQIVADKTMSAAFACPSLTGHTPKLLSALRPSQPIVATTHVESIYTKLLLFWGVCPMLTDECTTDFELINSSIEKSKEAGFLKKNGKVVIIAGLPINKPLMLNTIQIHFDGTTIARGRNGIGKTLQGKYYKAKTSHEVVEHYREHQKKNYIYSIPRLTYNDLPNLRDINALMVEQTSEVPMAVLKEQYPNIICVAEVSALMFQKIANDREIIISGNEKIIYEP